MLLRTKEPLFNTEGYNVIRLDAKFRSSLEVLCLIFLHAVRCKCNKFHYPNEISMQLSSLKLPAPTDDGFIIGIGSSIRGSRISKVFSDTVYSIVVDQCIDDIISANAMIDDNPITFVRFHFNYDNALCTDLDVEIPVRYRIGISLIVGRTNTYYCEFWEDLGWLVNDPSDIEQKALKIFPNIFFKPLADLTSLYFDRSNNKFICNGIFYNFRELSGIKLQALDTESGSISSFNDPEVEPNSVLVPFKSFIPSKLFNEGEFVEKFTLTYTANGIESFPMLRNVRASESLIAKLLTYLYTEEYYKDIEMLLLPRRFSEDRWKFIEYPGGSESFKHMSGMNIVIEFDSIMSIPSDRLSRIGISDSRIIKEARKAYTWFCSINWKLNWNQVMESSSKIVDSREIPFNNSKYRVSLNLTQIEAMFYFISSLQRYLLLVYCKLISKFEKYENKSSVSLFLGFNRMIETAIDYFNQSQNNEDKTFFRDRLVKVSGSNVVVSGLTGNAEVLHTNDIYCEWIKISKSSLRGSKVYYPPISIEIAEGITKEFPSIIDFLLSDLIRMSQLVMGNFEKSQISSIIEKIDFKSLYYIVTDADNLNHKRLCVELYKYYSNFYGNKLIVENYTEVKHE